MTAVLGILAALGSSFLRAALNVLDREIFGRRHGEVALVNLLNNLFPFLILLPIVVFLVGLDQTIKALINPSNLWLAGLIQLVAYAFSLAFRNLTIPQVIVFSKLPDLFIPLGIYALTGIWSIVDFTFSFLTTIICVPLLFFYKEPFVVSKARAKVLGFLMAAVILRGVFSGYLVQEQRVDDLVWLVVTVATIWWRFIWSLIVMAGILLIKRKFVWTTPKAELLMVRAGVTLGVQGLYVLALTKGPPVAIWPLINSTALFSVGLSSLVFREHPGGYELLAILIITFLTVGRIFYH